MVFTAVKPTRVKHASDLDFDVVIGSRGVNGNGPSACVRLRLMTLRPSATVTAAQIVVDDALDTGFFSVQLCTDCAVVKKFVQL